MYSGMESSLVCVCKCTAASEWTEFGKKNWFMVILS